jgi:hypothetical protein
MLSSPTQLSPVSLADTPLSASARARTSCASAGQRSSGAISLMQCICAAMSWICMLAQRYCTRGVPSAPNGRDCASMFQFGPCAGLEDLQMARVVAKKTLRDQLVGTWTFVGSTGKNADGSPIWGKSEH